MGVSNFNVIDVRMTDVEFETINQSFGGEIPLETKVESYYALAEDENKAKVKLIISVFPTVEDAPFRIKVIMEGTFLWSEDINEDELPVYLKVNGNAILYSYARPIISQLTSFAGFSTLVLPLNNFAEE